MKEWFTAAEAIALKLPAMPGTVRGFNIAAERGEWRNRAGADGASLVRPRTGRGGGWEYHYSLFPAMAQAKLVKLLGGSEQAVKPAISSAELWSFYERLPDARKAKAQERLAVIESVMALQRGGMTKDQAVHLVAGERDVGFSTVYAWFDLIAGKDRKDWLPLLTPRHAGRTDSAECDPEAWELLKGMYLRQSQQPLETCYEWAKREAEARGWKLPSVRTIARRIEREIPKPIVVYFREGQEALNRMFPPQERDRSMFHALEAVNVDGHKWDVFVKWDDGTIGRPMMVAIQDLYSNKILAWRVDRSENTDAVRLAFKDVFEQHGVPYHCYLDNGRAFASKYITGGTPNRYRFKVKPEEPVGILTQLGVQIHWTRPYSGQSKPIERAFGDLCNVIAKHPAFDGAYTGNSPDAKPENYGNSAVPLDEFLRVVGQGIAIYNSRTKRRTRVCGGVLSFDQAFQASMEAPSSRPEGIVRECPPAMLHMCMLAAMGVTAHRENGSVRLLGNRYWAECLHEYLGKPLTVRFDPDNLFDGVHVYRMDGVYIGFAECIEAAGYGNAEEARKHAQKVRSFVRKTKEAAELERQLAPADVATRLSEIEVEEPDAPNPRVVRLVHGSNVALQPQEEALAVDPAEIEKSFRVGLQLVQGGREE